MHCRNSENNEQLQENKMGQIKVEKNVGGIEGLCIIEPTVHGDNRGYFMETYNSKDMQEAGIDRVFVQDNQSKSSKGVLIIVVEVSYSFLISTGISNPK